MSITLREAQRRIIDECCENMRDNLIDDLMGDWRSHSKNFPKGEKPPQTLESLQAAWQRDQELLLDQAKEISRLKVKINNLNQKLKGFT